MKIRCPHCNSTKGYYTINCFHDVPVYYDFEGSVTKIDANVRESRRRKDAYCVNCNKVIMTARVLEMKMRGQNKDNPIAVYRKKAGYTQTQLAALLGCSRSSIAEWEKRNSLPRDKEQIKKMNKLFKNAEFMVELKDFYGYEK